VLVGRPESSERRARLPLGRHATSARTAPAGAIRPTLSSHLSAWITMGASIQHRKGAQTHDGRCDLLVGENVHDVVHPSVVEV